MEEMKPCPNCGHSSDWQFFSDDIMRRQCRCVNCGMIGPDAETLENAIAAWNALPRRLRWTKEKPTQEGWYWLKEEGHHAVVKMTAGGMISEPYVRHVNEVDGEWAGPIPEPEE